MRKLTIAATVVLFVPAFALAQPKSLFNGKDLSGWHTDVPKMDSDKLTQSPFMIRKGMIVLLANPYGHLITDSVYQNYRLQAEYRFPAAPGNTGVLVHASTPRVVNKMYPKAIELQLQHNNAGDLWTIGEKITAPDMENRRGNDDKQKGFYSYMVNTFKKWSGVADSKQNRIVKLPGDIEKPAGEWNTLVTECVGSYIKVWLNGRLVNYGYNCSATKGNIALQAEGSEVEFRKLVLMPITKITE